MNKKEQIFEAVRILRSSPIPFDERAIKKQLDELDEEQAKELLNELITLKANEWVQVHYNEKRAL